VRWLGWINFILKVSISPANGGTVSKTPNFYDYPSGKTVTLAATPSAGYQFSNWAGDATGSTTPKAIVMDKSKSITAVFTASQVQAPVLNVPSTSTGTFTVTVTYNWPASTSNLDRFELYENNTKIQDSTWGQHPSPWNVQLTRSPGSYTYKARAYVGSGSSPGWTPYSNEKTVLVQAAASKTRLHNKTVYYVVSLKIDNVEQITQYNTGIAPGYYYEKTLNPGWHSYSAYTGIWNSNGTRTSYYIYNGQFYQDNGQIENVNFLNPTINYLLTYNNSSLWWNGEWLFPKRDFKFYSNGSYDYYYNGSYVSSGTYSLVKYEAYKVTFYLNGLGTTGYLWDCLGNYFSMSFGDQQDQFYAGSVGSAKSEKRQ
jgi:hypothetical protein